MPKNYYALAIDTYNAKQNKSLEKGIYNEWKNSFEYIQGAKSNSFNLKAGEHWKGFETLEEAEAFYQEKYQSEGVVVIKTPMVVNMMKGTITTPDGNPITYKLEIPIHYFFEIKASDKRYEDTNIIAETDGKQITKIKLLNTQPNYDNAALNKKFPDLSRKPGYQRCHIISNAVLRRFICKIFEGKAIAGVCQYFNIKEGSATKNLTQLAQKIYGLYQELISCNDNLFLGPQMENEAQGKVAAFLTPYLSYSAKQYDTNPAMKEISNKLTQHMNICWPTLFAKPNNHNNNNDFIKLDDYRPASSHKSVLSEFYNANFSIPTSGFNAPKIKTLLACYDKIFRFCYVAKDFDYPLLTSNNKRKLDAISHQDDNADVSDAKVEVNEAKKLHVTIEATNLSKESIDNNIPINPLKQEIEEEAIQFANTFVKLTFVIPEELKADPTITETENVLSGLNNQPTQTKYVTKVFKL